MTGQIDFTSAEDPFYGCYMKETKIKKPHLHIGWHKALFYKKYILKFPCVLYAI